MSQTVNAEEEIVDHSKESKTVTQDQLLGHEPFGQEYAENAYEADILEDIETKATNQVEVEDRLFLELALVPDLLLVVLLPCVCLDCADACDHIVD